MSRFLYDIKPESVDSLHFCAAARKRVCIQNRFPSLPRQPLSIQEALSSTSKWWPSWDPRTKLNCLVTVIGSAKLTERIKLRLERSIEAEVALHRLGIPLKNVVSVDISVSKRDVIRSWWEQANQKGNLIEITDIQTINGSDIETWIRSSGGFDLVIGRSPCNNLAGGNRVSRDRLEGQHCSLFYQYVRVLGLVRNMMS
ncbi:hypothetical protein POTOM_046305 [Populus tomentosa]|uniref:SAM-dependent MTase DRM-type domain-containing protein n=1 Tax=Populus tomentosa TaxID=118781 RepID=A0A8X7YGJ9_POPTO|nr:hypothetical protein POTOM_046305 [Populus tomentosa]